MKDPVVLVHIRCHRFYTREGCRQPLFLLGVISVQHSTPKGPARSQALAYIVHELSSISRGGGPPSRKQSQVRPSGAYSFSFRAPTSPHLWVGSPGGRAG